jgi:hypothetical protein
MRELKVGEKLEYTTEYAFGKGTAKEIVTVIAINRGKALLSNGIEVPAIYHTAPKKRA